MENTWLTLSEVAECENVDYNVIRVRNQRNVYTTKTEKNPQGGKDLVYISFDCLSEKAKKRYRKIQQDKLSQTPDKDVCDETQSLEDLTAEQRDTALFWKNILDEWQSFRSEQKRSGESLGGADERFAEIIKARYPDLKFTVKTLYRKMKNYREKGVSSLADKRGLHSKGTSTIDPQLWDVFESLWLDESQRTASLCYKLTKVWAEKNIENWDGKIQSLATFNRHIKEIPLPVQIYFREGDKACEDKAMPYIIRRYDNLESNDIWVGDNHTLDFMVRDEKGELHRYYITTYLDVKSRKIMSCYVTANPDSNSNLYAMRRGFLKYGIPREFYLDNGREFLVHDIGGRGRRKTAKTDEHTPPTILKRLGIKMTNARVRNGRAKIVERVFREVKENFSKLFLSYTGGNVVEKPERLKGILKKGGGVDIANLNEFVQTWVDGYYNKQPHNGSGMRGKCPDEVWAENLIKQRLAGEDELNLMLMRSTRMQKVGRLGVYVKIAGEKINYWDTEFIKCYQGQKVYVRYDPLNLSQVRVYDENDRYLVSVKSDMSAIMDYGANVDDLKEAIHKVNAVKREMKSYRRNRGLDDLPDAEAIDLMMYKAKANIAEFDFKANPKVLELVRANEDAEVTQKAVGGNDFVIDTAKMLENARKNKKGGV